MTSLFQAVNATGTTANGAVTNISSMSKNVDFFFLAGSSRGKDLKSVFSAAYGEDSEVAIRVLQWARDARGGAGERATFRNLFSTLIVIDEPVSARVLAKIPDLGRWDDVLVAFGTPLERASLAMIATALKVDANGLCAKWMPRQGKQAGKIRSYMKLTPRDYRKLIVGLSNTVEQKMCAREWSQIVYDHVPSVAAARYQKAFGRNDQARYSEYREKLVKGEAKINASSVFPYDVIRGMKNGDRVVASKQWDSLPDYLEGTDERVLVVADVSGSMGSAVSPGLSAMDVCVSLAMYLSERLTGVFKDQFVTFSDTPTLQKLSGDLYTRYTSLINADWGMSTNIQAVFELVLKAAQKHGVPESEMPTKIMILSDMEFNTCVTTTNSRTSRYGGQNGVSVSAIDMIREQYADSGYKLPQVVFWNLNGRSGNSPVTYNETRTALVSGFSPSIMRSLLGGEDMSPMGIMLKTVMNQRYDF